MATTKKAAPKAAAKTEDLEALWPKTKFDALDLAKRAKEAWGAHKAAGGVKGVDEPLELRAFNAWVAAGRPMPAEGKTRKSGGVKVARGAALDEAAIPAVLLEVLKKNPVSSGSAATKAMRLAGHKVSGGPVRRAFAALVKKGEYTVPDTDKPKREPRKAVAKAPAKKAPAKKAAAAPAKKAASKTPAKKAPLARKEVTPIPKKAVKGSGPGGKSAPINAKSKTLTQAMAAAKKPAVRKAVK